MSDFLSAFSLVVAAGSLLLALAAFKVQRRRTNMEVARTLHFDLTTGEVAKARESLGTITRDRQVLTSGDPAARKARFVDARTDYFTLLWCFERIWAARLAITDDEGREGQGAACRYLDQLVGWHVRNWARDLPVVKNVLELELASRIQDQDSSLAFGKLSGALLTPQDRSDTLTILKDQGLEPVGYKQWPA